MNTFNTKSSLLIFGQEESAIKELFNTFYTIIRKIGKLIVFTADNLATLVAQHIPGFVGSQNSLLHCE